ncbi:MAG: 16S rRNA (guanine(527)-N(7))-methyltransferase RsmG [Lachnospiraceae bacterium]|jgi:16S rRNA (guanine527-N7)-methyltransferase|nr:16S rRNA (guanine(527)-N(7))-methyltransferase RsmG [Lachnospiraceae bacterium]
MNEKLNKIEERIRSLDLDISAVQVRQFYDYYELLVKWNQFMNLTAITDFEDVVQKHFVDSLSITGEKKLQDVDNLIDVGTGAGFPGIPLKIMFPELKITLLDSLRKRVDFLNEVIDRLHLKQMETIHGRAEDYAKPGKKREMYDLCVSRAVANLSTLSEYCLPYVKIGGEFISYKSGEITEEMKEAKSAVFLLGGRIRGCRNFELPGTEIHRTLVCIEKVSGCPKKYPRKAGTAAKNPL